MIRKLGMINISKIIKNKKGLGTVEIVIIIAVLVGLALIFRDAIVDFAVRIMNSVFDTDNVIDSLDRANFTTSGG